MQQVEAYTAGGVASGAIAEAGALHEALDAARPVDLDRATWYPLAGGGAERHSRVHLDAEELLAVSGEPEDLPIHASWHGVELHLGPYRVRGELPTLPGFDPGRALARPGGAFILLRDVTVELAGHPEGGRVTRPHALVNRYAVEEVAADIELGFYFPGARFLTAGQASGRPAALPERARPAARWG